MAEVAGLVLGGIPLLISAMEHYQECFRMLDCMVQYKKEHRKCLNKMRNLELLYGGLLDALFGGLVNDEELERLKTCPGDDGWVEMERMLKVRLPPKLHTAYLDTMQDLSEVVKDLGGKLGLDKSVIQARMTKGTREARPIPSSTGNSKSKLSTTVNSIFQSSLERMTYEAQRAKFAQGRKERDALIDEIEGYIKSLNDLLSMNDCVAGNVRNSQRTHLLHRGLLEFWRHAANLYSILSRSWNCSCISDHCADLRLLHRDTADREFEICFHSSHRGVACHGNSWLSYSAVIVERKGIENMLASSNALRSTSDTSTKSTIKHEVGASHPLASALRKSSKKPGVTQALMASSSVSFAMAAPLASSISSPYDQVNEAEELSVGARLIAQVPQKALIKIGNLCEAISKHDNDHPCSGLLASQEIDTEYAISPRTSHQPTGGKTITLSSLLEHSTMTPTRAQRYDIALTVASSHLQLHPSPWLGFQWDSRDIIFVVENGSPLLDQPHLRTTFEATAQTAGHMSIDRTFNTLGVVLLELCFGTSLEKSPFRQMYSLPGGAPDPIMDWGAARKWAEQVEGEAGTDYAHAVGWCLGIIGPQPNDDSWRTEFHRHVIEPLRISRRNFIP